MESYTVDTSDKYSSVHNVKLFEELLIILLAAYLVYNRAVSYKIVYRWGNASMRTFEFECNKTCRILYIDSFLWNI